MNTELKDVSADWGVAQVSTEAANYQDALQFAVTLKKKHADRYAADPKGFSRIVRKAHAAFRRKPGPAPDPNVLKAAEERVGGAKWSDLYQQYNPTTPPCRSSPRTALKPGSGARSTTTFGALPG